MEREKEGKGKKERERERNGERLKAGKRESGRMIVDRINTH